MLKFLKRIIATGLLACIIFPTAVYSQTTLVETDFKKVEYGNIPDGWADVMDRQPSRNWMVDGNQFLRPVLKGQKALIAWIGTGGKTAKIPADVEIVSEFKKTEDSEVFFGLAGRIMDKYNFYAVLLSGHSKLSIVKVMDGKTKVLTEMVLLNRYRYPDRWQLSASFTGDIITGIVRNEKGSIMARADFKDGTFTTGTFGIYATEYTGAASLTCTKAPLKNTAPMAKSEKSPRQKKSVKAKRPAKSSKSVKSSKPAKPSKSLTGYTPPANHNTRYSSYRIIKPAAAPDRVNTGFRDISASYDIVVAGAGTGGWAAAVQAARMGKKVLLLEETDWIGGQMAAAAVTSMDESGPEVRERAIYRQFHESIVLYYYTRDKDPFQAYYSGRLTQNQQSGGYEPAVARAILYGFIEDARKNGNGGKLDVALRSRVTSVKLKGKKVVGAKITNWKENGEEESRDISCSILIDATEYGDVIPLTGNSYRVGNTKSENIDMKGAVQDHTFTGVLREYPDGIPAHLKMTAPPPGYETYKRTYANKTYYGDWGLNKGTRMYRVALAWRGMADTRSPLRGRLTGLRHTLADLNGGNDYPTSVATIESLEKRMEDEKVGIYKTLSIVYYLQHELGVNWSFAEDQGYNTPYNRLMMKKRGIVPEMLPYARYLPQMPYVRESRRISGIKTMVADDLERGANTRHFSTSVAVGDYFMDLHHTYEFLEFDLDRTNYTHKSGPFQLPFEAFIPASIDGFLVAEKNFSQSRLVSGATRLQPITMLTGQAVGTIASLALSQHVQPRQLKPMQVQLHLLDEGATLIPRWFTDVTWNTELWKAVQLMCLYKIMDRPGDITSEDGMQFKYNGQWGAARTVSESEAATALKELAIVLGIKPAKITATSSVRPFLSSADLKELARKTGLGHVMSSGQDTLKEKITQNDLALFCLSCARIALKVK